MLRVLPTCLVVFLAVGFWLPRCVAQRRGGKVVPVVTQASEGEGEWNVDYLRTPQWTKVTRGPPATR